MQEQSSEQFTDIVALQEVTFAYQEDAPPALSGVSLAIAPGEFVAVLGHNGSGKSSLAKLCNALHLPTGGTVTVCGMNTRDEALLWNIRQSAGMVFQNPDNQLVSTIVEEDVAFGLENLGTPQPQIRPKVDEALRAVSMYDCRASAPHMLSGGQKQRVAIAGVLAMAPRVMILDEATAMLDPSGRREVLATMHGLHRERGITVVWITHSMSEAATAERVVVLKEGQLALTGTPRQVFRQVERLRELGLDVPPMTEMAHGLRERGVQVPDDILTVQEMVEELCRLSSRA
ncbi:MAG: energy-coupling factor transporter ATPase [Clostridia bacterium]|nr:energy-coupling factor transporter ATPase [Clostridia bacterium]